MCHRIIKHRCHAIVNSPRVKRSESQDGCNYRLQPPPRLQLRLATSPCQMSYHLRTYALPGPQSHHLEHYCLCLLLMMVELVNHQTTLNVSPQIGRSHLVLESSPNNSHLTGHRREEGMKFFEFSFWLANATSESSNPSQYFSTTRIKMQVPVRLLVHAGKDPELATLCFTEFGSDH